jgi:hypothetical protein
MNLRCPEAATEPAAASGGTTAQCAAPWPWLGVAARAGLAEASSPAESASEHAAARSMHATGLTRLPGVSAALAMLICGAQPAVTPVGVPAMVATGL